MGKDNTCKAVPNRLNGEIRASCSWCGAIWTENDVKGSCPSCHRRIKPSKFSNKFNRQTGLRRRNG